VSEVGDETERRHALRRYTRDWQRSRAAVSAAAYLPLRFAPGEAYQFDWSRAIVVMADAAMTVNLAHAR
jgi:arginyl-tRNA synthetase